MILRFFWHLKDRFLLKKLVNLESKCIKRSVKSWTTRFCKGFLEITILECKLRLWKSGQYNTMEWTGFLFFQETVYFPYHSLNSTWEGKAISYLQEMLSYIIAPWLYEICKLAYHTAQYCILAFWRRQNRVPKIYSEVHNNESKVVYKTQVTGFGYITVLWKAMIFLQILYEQSL